MLHRYELVRLLGRGAAGDVYLARDRLLGGREVALKRIRARVDDTLRGAFEREFSTMASLSVPGVARVFDFGLMELDGGGERPFYTRAYIDGEPLDVAVDEKSPAQRVALVCQVAGVIAPLHRAGVVHGDIKPGNAIIDRDGLAHVIDFGLARLLGQGGDEDAGGTLAFMAPELGRGAGATVQSDVFALGVTLWYLLTGDYPFGEIGAIGSGARQLPDVPTETDEISRAALGVARRALALDPLDRLPTVDELIVALREAAELGDDDVGRQVFVPPRPRGHAETLGRLQALATGAPRVAGARCVLLHGPRGAGKSSLTRELKWRLQLRGGHVFEVAAGGGGVVAPLTALFRQLAVARGSSAGERALSALSAGRIDEGELAESLAQAIATDASAAPLVLLVDDLDRAESLFGAVLRSAIHADGVGAVRVIVTAADAEAPAVRELGAAEPVQVPRLSRADSDALATDALGPIDASVLHALHERTGGLPGALVDALAVLSSLPAPTVADVDALPPPGASVALAEARLSRVEGEGVQLLQVVRLLGGTTETLRLREAAGAVGLQDVDAALEACEAAGLITRSPGSAALADGALERALAQRLGDAGRRELSCRLLREDVIGTWPLPLRARLAVLAGDEARIRELVPAAARALSEQGAHAGAAELLEALVGCAEGGLRDEARLALARARQALGELERAARLAGEVLGDAQASGARVDAAIVSARALTALGRYDDAVQALQLVPGDAERSARARMLRELAKVHLRRGDYDALTEAAEAGLALEPESLVRAELLASRAMAASFRGEHDAARAALEEAVALARAAGSPRDEATARATLAVAHFRTGDLVSARDMFAQSLEIYRRLGDVASMANSALNLGALMFFLGDPAAAAEHYESAARLARRAGRLSTVAQARCNLAHVHIYFGLFERARSEIADVLGGARRDGQRYVEAQATALLGELAARMGDVEQALIHYDDALARYAELGQKREVADHNLDAAEALLDRAGPADASAAAARLATAREAIERHDLDDLKLTLDLLLARAMLTSGDPEGALPGLEDVLERARKAHKRDVEWSALAAMGLCHEALGAEFAARRHRRMAVEVLEDIALRVPREHRDAFWHDQRRRMVRERAAQAEDSSHHAQPSGEMSALIGDPRAERLLEIMKRLAGEHDLDRLLERITESAVDLSGAERGFVLLTDRQGQLEKRTVQVAKRAAPDPHEAFSRSIAEAVLIDGEPIVTTDASADGRLSEFVSVHKLMLRSVACMPIRSPEGTVGVLYLEHRRSRGRFTEASMDLLAAFADQAAIALQNARLMAENVRRREELEVANAALEKAKQDVEELLSARTDELEEARRELTRARRSRRDAAIRHGMVGKSQAMLRVFDTIDRLKDAAVPVVIHGESGTGKELVARAVHYGGRRAKAPFVAINCGSVPESLLESELFGHVKGAFSGADRDKRGLISRASGGTLFLDEVGDMPAKMQVDLLRVLQEGTVCKVGGDQEERVDVRFLAASNKRLDELVGRGEFREDLYYRLNVVEVSLPALRDRREDIPLLCQHFLDTFAERDGQPAKRLSGDAMECIMAQSLPGNVRQLEHMLLQAWVMVDGTVIGASDLSVSGAPIAVPQATRGAVDEPSGGRGAVEVAAPAGATDGAVLEPMSVRNPPANRDQYKDAERQRILAALEDHAWNRAQAARSLGMPRRTFYRRLQQYGIQ
ncbi:MAG: sigma 54-interacting transcriptional regulator [Myxococcales bacterium]|jgi:transcriptional regulator with GAF, ATPase, and Fis domain/predicted Ser/Thr protein kinase